MRLSHHPAVEVEVIEAGRFYEERVSGLGAQFFDEFDAAVVEILQAPGRWRIVRDDKRRYLMRRFPFGIYYRIAGDTVRILVLKHHSRHPAYGNKRV